MCSAFRDHLWRGSVAAGALLGALLVCGFAHARTVPVCADPNNLPFSNDRREGFENRIVELVARDLCRRIEYVWKPQRRGFIRTTLRAGLCDVMAGVPAGFEPLATTRPYYRSTYVFVTRS